MSVSPKTFERVAELVGKRIEAEVSSFEKHILSGLADIPDIAPERLYVTIDGATVPMVGSRKWALCMRRLWTKTETCRRGM